MAHNRSGRKSVESRGTRPDTNFRCATSKPARPAHHFLEESEYASRSGPSCKAAKNCTHETHMVKLMFRFTTKVITLRPVSAATGRPQPRASSAESRGRERQSLSNVNSAPCQDGESPALPRKPAARQVVLFIVGVAILCILQRRPLAGLPPRLFISAARFLRCPIFAHGFDSSKTPNFASGRRFLPPLCAVRRAAGRSDQRCRARAA